jgi:Ca-activated chloride channel homolog
MGMKGSSRGSNIARIGAPKQSSHRIMRYTTYAKYVPELADAVNLQGLLDQLADFLLQSGFAGGPYSHPYWGEFGEEEGDRSQDALRKAILQALIESGQLTPEMLKVLNGESTGDPAKDAEVMRQVGELLDRIVQRLMDEGYLNVTQTPQVPQSHQPVFGPGGMAQAAAQHVQFNLTDKGIDFLGYRTLKHLLGSIGKSSFGAHETEHLATGVEAEAASRPYQFGDTLNLDVNATLSSAIAREGLGVPINLEYEDLMVHQAEYRSSSATVLMLDCSHSMILYGEDRFTPAKKVALALTHLIRTQYPGDSLRVVLFHDSAEEIPLSRLAHAQVGPYHTNTAEGLKLARRILSAQRKDMRQIIMITDGKPSALTMPDGRIYVNSMGLDPQILQATYREVAQCRRAGILINTFMLARERSLVEFVKRVSAICRGKAYFTNTMTLGQFILMDFMRRKTRRVS